MHAKRVLIRIRIRFRIGDRPPDRSSAREAQLTRRDNPGLYRRPVTEEAARGGWQRRSGRRSWVREGGRRRRRRRRKVQTNQVSESLTEVWE